jgi:hypothetical protein
LELTGLASKSLSAASQVAPLLGALSGWGSAPRAEGGEGIGNQIGFVVNAIKNFKIADPIKTTELALSKPESYPIGSGIGLAITGYIVKKIGDAVGITEVERLGAIALKGGSSAAVNGLAASYIYEAQNNPHPRGTAGYGAGSVNTIKVDNPQQTWGKVGGQSEAFSYEGAIR